jgi:uncharacterized protein
MAAELRFLAAPPLGRLCRWLRTLGFDCVYLEHEQADHHRPPGGRIYLSRHADAAGRQVLFIGRDGVFDQLRVMDRLVSINGRSRPLSRCIHCNTPLAAADRLLVKQVVPEHVFLSHDRFTRCRSCGRIYWPGTHVDRIEERIVRLFGKRCR